MPQTHGKSKDSLQFVRITQTVQKKILHLNNNFQLVSKYTVYSKFQTFIKLTLRYLYDKICYQAKEQNYFKAWKNKSFNNILKKGNLIFKNGKNSVTI